MNAGPEVNKAGFDKWYIEIGDGTLITVLLYSTL